jgi:hypothetical protein
MSRVAPLLRIPVGVVVERRKARSRWIDSIWRPVAVLAGSPDTAPWTRLGGDKNAERFYAGAAEIELYRSEADNYRGNLASELPRLWAVLQPSGSEPPYAVAAVTADPAEGEGFTEAGQAIVEALPMPESVRGAIAVFVAEYHVERIFEKRMRDRADPEALARRDRKGTARNGR